MTNGPFTRALQWLRRTPPKPRIESAEYRPSPWLTDALRKLAAEERSAVESLLRNTPDGVEPCEQHYLEGAAAFSQGDVSAAIAAYRVACTARADFAAAHYALGVAEQAAGEHCAAQASFRRAVAIKHDYTEALAADGHVSFLLGQFEDARDAFELALAFDPRCVAALIGLARLCRETGANQQAAEHLRRALDIAPGNAEAYFEYGRVLNASGDTPGALAAYRRAVECKGDYVVALVNLGLLYLGQIGDARQAQQLFERAAALEPHSVGIQANLGLALQEQGKFKEALAHYDALIARRPQEIEYRWNRAIALLTQGDLERGWEDYELRHVRGGRDVRRHLPFPEWDGSNAAAHHILVYAEQGVGDEIMFASCVPDLLRLGANVVLECDKRLATLFQRSLSAAKVCGASRNAVNRDWLAAYPQIDRQIATGSLPRFFRKRAAEFPQHNGYLVADPLRKAQWQARLANRDRFVNVGLSWRGGTRGTRAELRSLAFEACLPWLALPRCRFVILERGDQAAALSAAGKGADLRHWPEALEDLDEMAALIAALDLVVTVQNTTAHLSGALGQRAWVLLPQPAEWRYGWDGAAMPWYPSMQLFRQPTAGEWRPVIAAIGSALTRFTQA